MADKRINRFSKNYFIKNTEKRQHLQETRGIRTIELEQPETILSDTNPSTSVNVHGLHTVASAAAGAASVACVKQLQESSMKT